MRVHKLMQTPVDIKVRNEVIQIMWLKKYTTIGPQRPTWALVADVLIEENIAKSKNIDKEVTMNTYLQSRSPKANATSTLPLDLKRMLGTGKKQPTPRHVKNARKHEETAPRMVPPRSRRQPSRVQSSSSPQVPKVQTSNRDSW